MSLPKFQPSDISLGLSDLTKSYIPDFGYTNQLEFEDRSGWDFFLDFVSKYPKREKTANMIHDLILEKEMKVI